MANPERTDSRRRPDVLVRVSGRRLEYSWPPPRRGLLPRVVSAAVLVAVALVTLVLVAAVVFVVAVVVAAAALAALVLGARRSRREPR